MIISITYTIDFLLELY